MKPLHLARLAAIACIAAAGHACENAPNNPAAPSTSPLSSAVTLRAIIVLNAPAKVHLGEARTAQAVASYSDGTFVDVTTRATWHATGTACRVDGGGKIEAVGGGTSEITAEFESVKSTAVAVACGFFITVTTHESFPTEHVLVPGALGQILDGPLAGHTFVTDEGGRAVLPPVGGPGFVIHFKKPGFENYLHRVTQLPRESSIRIPMTPEFTAQVSFQGQCSNASFQRLIDNYNFTTGRTGKIRMRVDLQSDGVAPFAELFGTIEGLIGQVSEHASVKERPSSTSPNRPIAEMRVDAGNYRMGLTAINGCSPTDFWRATLDYSR